MHPTVASWLLVYSSLRKHTRHDGTLCLFFFLGMPSMQLTTPRRATILYAHAYNVRLRFLYPKERHLLTIHATSQLKAVSAYRHFKMMCAPLGDSTCSGTEAAD